MTLTAITHALDRTPAATGPVRELVVETGSIRLSGLASDPIDAAPRALIVAIHGAGMHAGYFDCPSDRRLSLFESARRLGFAVWAPDRPGVVGSSGTADQMSLEAQAEALLDGIEAFASEHDVGGGVMLLGHSFGLKVALVMAGSERGNTLLGVDGSGTALRYDDRFLEERKVRSGARAPADNFWGPEFLYPAGTTDRARLPLSQRIAEPPLTFDQWPDYFRQLAPRIQIPIRFVLGEYERIWATDPASLEELGALMSGSPDVRVGVQLNAAHNTSLGWSALAYHLGALAFAEDCLLRRTLSK